jgi:hypothetical protein
VWRRGCRGVVSVAQIRRSSLTVNGIIPLLPSIMDGASVSIGTSAVLAGAGSPLFLETFLDHPAKAAVYPGNRFRTTDSRLLTALHLAPERCVALFVGSRNVCAISRPLLITAGTHHSTVTATAADRASVQQATGEEARPTRAGCTTCCGPQNGRNQPSGGNSPSPQRRPAVDGAPAKGEMVQYFRSLSDILSPA